METAKQHFTVTEEPFELVIRLQQFKAESPLDGAMVRAQALVKDVLLSKLRVDAEIDAQENVRAQGFTDLGKVLAASRALQIAFEGFRDASSAGHTSVAMVLDSPPVVDPDISSISPPIQEVDLITSAKPSQVLITRRFFNRVPYSHSALRLLSMQGDVYEFLWTNEQKLDAMQAEAARMPAHVKEPTPAPELVEPVVYQPTVSLIPEPPAQAPEWQDSEVAAEPESTMVQPAELETTVPDHSVASNWFSGRRVFALAAGVVAVMVLGWFLSSYVFPGKRAATTKDTPPPTDTRSVAPATTPAAPVTELPIPKAGAKTPLTNVLSTPPKPGVSSKPVGKSNACAIDGPIPAFLKRAEADSSNGRYESAIRRFSEILECEPGNREAAQELQKAKDSQKYAP